MLCKTVKVDKKLLGLKLVENVKSNENINNVYKNYFFKMFLFGTDTSVMRHLIAHNAWASMRLRKT